MHKNKHGDIELDIVDVNNYTSGFIIADDSEIIFFYANFNLETGGE